MFEHSENMKIGVFEHELGPSARGVQLVLSLTHSLHAPGPITDTWQYFG